MTSNEIRQKFLDFFASKGHTIVPSAPMVVKNDPTLMFTNAGMNQFKDIFLGNVTPKTHRATDSQKCLRVSGKHNDLEEVGHDSYHHTMFEMLGNWSFGDYFKTEAISWAWELLTEVYKIDKTKLYATVFEGSKEDGTSLDEEARQTWLKYLPEDHVLLGDKHDNFWEMGDTGPCGPCSEIHIDLRSDEEIAKVPGRELVNKSNPLVIEIWNLVFMQFNRKANGELELLPNHNIDTGYNSNDPAIFLIISELLTKEIDKDKIYRKVFNNFSSNAIRFRGHLMDRKLHVFEDLHAAFYTVTRQEMKRYGFIKGDLEGLVNEPLRIRGMKFTISLREDTEVDGRILVSLRSVDDFPCNKVASEFFNGGGHLNASGGRLNATMEEAERIACQAIEAYAHLLR